MSHLLLQSCPECCCFPYSLHWKRKKPTVSVTDISKLLNFLFHKKTQAPRYDHSFKLSELSKMQADNIPFELSWLVQQTTSIVRLMSQCNRIFCDIIFTFARKSSKSLRSFQRFRRILVLNFMKIQQRVKNFPIDPHCKNCPISAKLSLPKAGNFYNGGLWGNSSSVVESTCNFASEFV